MNEVAFSNLNFGKKSAESLGELGLSRLLPALSLRLCQGREAGGRRGSPASGGPRDRRGRRLEWEQLASGTLEKDTEWGCLERTHGFSSRAAFSTSTTAGCLERTTKSAWSALQFTVGFPEDKIEKKDVEHDLDQEFSETSSRTEPEEDAWEAGEDEF